MQTIEQHPSGRRTDPLPVYPHRGQRGVDEPGKQDVVCPGNRHIIGHAATEVQARAESADRDEIVITYQAVYVTSRREQLARRLITAVDIRAAAMHGKRRVGRDASRGQRITVAAHTGPTAV